tara:strand:- start:103 stop:1398 length:1296 start_codon:yes stop_codon:yes gene_type:complete
MNIGEEIYDLCDRLFPICRSITGNGNRKTLQIIQDNVPCEISVHEVPTGYQAYDWEIPQEWSINDAYILDPSGNKIVDFKDSNLHVVNYSAPVHQKITLEELQEHLYSAPGYPDAIPYVTSYYNRRWGFCLEHEKREKLQDGEYTVFIDSELKDGSLTYGEVIIPGETNEEVFLTTYICHPSMANNECSGPAVVTYLIKWLLEQNRRYTYRVVFAPETIGAITYISKNYDTLKENIIAGFNVTCIGDNNNYSFMPSRLGGTLTDKVAKHVLDNFTDSYNEYSFLQKGSDERQYCHPNVDLPLVTIMRSKYGTYPEYHTSKDNMDFISPEGLFGGYNIVKSCIEALESNYVYKSAVICEPKLSKRNMVPKDWHKRRTGGDQKSRYDLINMMNALFYCDGNHDVVDVANVLSIDFRQCMEYIDALRDNKIIKK